MSFACQGPSLHGPPFDQGIFDHVEQAFATGMQLGELLGHAEIGERYMAHLVIQVTDHQPLQILIQWFGKGWENDLPAVGPGVVALGSHLDTELLGQCSRQPFKLAFEWVT